MPKKIEKDLNKVIRKKWKLTSIDIAVNFAIACVKSYLRDHPYVQFNEQTMVDYSCFLLRRIDYGLKKLEMKEEDRIRYLGTILRGYVEFDVHTEAKYQKHFNEKKAAFEFGEDTSQRHVNKTLKKTDLMEKGMYV